MAVTTLEFLRKNRMKRLEIGRRHGACHMRIFASTICGDDTLGSDVDFLVDMEQGRSLLYLVGLQQKLEQFLERPVDVLTERGINQHLKEHILHEAWLV